MMWNKALGWCECKHWRCVGLYAYDWFGYRHTSIWYGSKDINRYMGLIL